MICRFLVARMLRNTAAYFTVEIQKLSARTRVLAVRKPSAFWRIAVERGILAQLFSLIRITTTLPKSLHSNVFVCILFPKLQHAPPSQHPLKTSAIQVSLFCFTRRTPPKLPKIIKVILKSLSTFFSPPASFNRSYIITITSKVLPDSLRVQKLFQHHTFPVECRGGKRIKQRSNSSPARSKEMSVVKAFWLLFKVCLFDYAMRYVVMLQNSNVFKTHLTSATSDQHISTDTVDSIPCVWASKRRS